MTEYKPPIHLVRWTAHHQPETRPICAAEPSAVFFHRTTLREMVTCPDCLRLLARNGADAGDTGE
jgi:hypothetical protein